MITLLLIVVAGFYWFFGKSPVKFSTLREPGATIFVSKLSPVMVSLLVNTETLRSLEKQGEISQIKNSLLAKTNIDFPDDIQPWLSNEVTLAVTSQDLDRDPKNGLQPGYLMVLATENRVKSREFVELLFSQRVLAGKNLEVKKYKGVKLFYDDLKIATSDKPKNSLAAAVVDKFVLFANHPQVLREAINNVQAPNLNLSSSSQYQKAISELPEDAIAVAFLNLPQVSEWQGLELAVATYNQEIISLVLNPQGFLVESTFLTNSPVAPPSMPLSPSVGALRYIPETVGFAVSGADLSNLGESNLAKLWKQATTTIYGSPQETISRWVPALWDLEQSWDLNLKEDIFSWIVGEYAIALLPNPENATVDWIFVVETSPNLGQGISKLDQIAINNGLNINSVSLNDQKLTAWTELRASQKPASVNVDTKFWGVHTTVDNYEIFTSNLTMMAKILSQQQHPLSENSHFQDSIATIPQPNQGYLYIDWQKSQDFLEHQQPLLKFVEILGKPLFENLRSLTVSSYGQKQGIFKAGLFFQLDR